MARRTPTVRDDVLQDGAEAIPLDTTGWWEWLARHALFRFEDAAGSFTARRERRAGGDYWYAYRRRAGRLRNAYLGKDADLTPQRLRLVARQLAAPDPAMSAPDTGFAGKTAIPLVAAASVARDRLLPLLDAPPRPTLTLVTAPAGYGKTTLLAQWAEGLRIGSGRSQGHPRYLANPQSKNPRLAWLSLDVDDNDPARLQRHLVAALVGAGVRAADLPRRAGLVELAVAATGAHGLVLVLDDYQLITESALHAAVAALLDAAPPGLHLVIASRTASPLPLARLRVGGRLRELTWRDLRFTRAEAEALLGRDSGLAPDALDALDGRAEGWAAALQLAAHALRGRDPAEQRAIVAASGGAQRLIEEYLVAEVLDRLPAPLRDFLLSTAVADRLCADLGAALTGLDAATAAATLRELERAVLLVQPLDAPRRWYRYHPLLAECLRTRLGQADPARLARLHGRAARWCAAHGLLAEAARHFAAAGAHDELSELVITHAAALMARGEIATLRAWLAALPPRLLREYPDMTLWHAWTLSLGDDPDAVEPHLLTLEARLEELAARIEAHLPVPPYARRCNPAALLGQADAMRVGLARRRGDDAGAIAYAERALRRLPPDLVIAGVVAHQLGLVHLRGGDLAAAEAALSAARSNAERTGHALLLVGALNGLARARLARGDHAGARALLQRARRAAAGAGGDFLADLVVADPPERSDLDTDAILREPLRPREREVLRLLAEGLTNRAIADALHLAPDTIRWHARNLYAKLGATNRTQATALARRLGLLP